MENENKVVVLNESKFTGLCKIGFMTIHNEMGRDDLYLSKTDIKSLYKNKEITKFQGDTYVIKLNMTDDYLIKDIIKRSPLFSDMYYELD